MIMVKNMNMIIMTTTIILFIIIMTIMIIKFIMIIIMTNPLNNLTFQWVNGNIITIIIITITII